MKLRQSASSYTNVNEFVIIATSFCYQKRQQPHAEMETF